MDKVKITINQTNDTDINTNFFREEPEIADRKAFEVCDHFKIIDLVVIDLTIILISLAQEVHKDRQVFLAAPLNLKSLPRVIDNLRPLRYVSDCPKIALKNPILLHRHIDQF